MIIFYDRDRDYAEVFFKKTANYQSPIKGTSMSEFRSERSDKVVGYGFEDASHSVFECTFLNSSAKLAVLLKILRAEKEISQAQAARTGGIGLRNYQRLESGEDNTTLKTLESLSAVFPEADFSVILKHLPKDVA